MKKWNKLLALLLAMVMALGTTVTAYADGEEATGPAEDTNTAENVETTEEPAEDAAPAEGEDAAAPAEDETPAEDAAPVEGEDAAAAFPGQCRQVIEQVPCGSDLQIGPIRAKPVEQFIADGFPLRQDQGHTGQILGADGLPCSQRPIGRQ